MAERSRRVPVEERLFSLVLALLSTETGLTKEQILSTVQGYRQRYTSGGDNDTLDRQFERDKEDLRELGVPLETLGDLTDAGNNHNLRYSIPRGQFELPGTLSFTPEESALLGLAAVVWREGSLSQQSRRALVKLRSLGLTTAEPPLGRTTRARVRDASFDPLSTAIDRGNRVGFTYLKPGHGHPSPRQVDPLALVNHQGRWHLYAALPGTGDTRTFLLSRITGPVKPLGAADIRGTAHHAATALDELTTLWDQHLACVRVVPGSEADVRLRNRPDTVESAPHRLTIHYTDPNLLADELTAFGPEVTVESPEALRAAVTENLRTLMSTHAPLEDGAP